MSDTENKRTCWVVTDGRAGIENQALGLANAVSRLVPLDISIKRLSVKWPWRSMPERLWASRPFGKLDKVLDEDNNPDGQGLEEPWPDLWIGCGRLSVPYSVAVHQTRRSYVVQTQDPRVPLQGFDLVIPPFHDGVSGTNVISIHGAPTRLTANLMAEDAKLLEEALPNLPRPRIAALIGGNSRAFRMTPAVIENIIDTLKTLAEDGAGVMITTSRRTGKVNETLIHDALGGFDNVFFWQGDKIGELANPYAGMLGLADHILVTQESTNMITEAATTGKPVHILPMEKGNTKFASFHDSLKKQGITRPVSLPLADWSYSPLRETDRAAKELVKRWLGRLSVK
ncbi:nucleoside-diphosphate sugar epimerase [Parvularcula flava]|uniref:Nucleoside-diphosphate sugar epimerase n=1 Tax=Aquisalinus luteolus TaxID=1566827 RepID=A0A8J3A618_9PROT|nr:mitochondrial fission ELM1 family protein [Aquisalinus luteolus]NHK27020.1 nucleoside-diphosphate sugar epimerase [Aquisalinus luteolus]GGH94121.1 nucleoside-diphosphate sugar epimerase [Aquisalinus luteolus]